MRRRPGRCLWAARGDAEGIEGHADPWAVRPMKGQACSAFRLPPEAAWPRIISGTKFAFWGSWKVADTSSYIKDRPFITLLCLSSPTSAFFFLFLILCNFLASAANNPKDWSFTFYFTLEMHFIEIPCDKLSVNWIRGFQTHLFSTSFSDAPKWNSVQSIALSKKKKNLSVCNLALSIMNYDPYVRIFFQIVFVVLKP